MTAATDAMKQASDRVRVLESALAVAIQQDAAAQTELRHAKRHASIEAECAALADLKIIGLRGDQLFETVSRLATDAAHAADKLRLSGGNEAYAYVVNEIRGQFTLFLGLAAHPLSGSGHVPDAFKKYRRFSDAIPDPEFARTRKRDE